MFRDLEFRTCACLPQKLLKAWPYGYPTMSYLVCDMPQLSFFGLRASLHICSMGWLECKDVNKVCCTVSSSFLGSWLRLHNSLSE